MTVVRSRRRLWPWLIGAGSVLVALLVATVVLAALAPEPDPDGQARLPPQSSAPTTATRLSATAVVPPVSTAASVPPSVASTPAVSESMQMTQAIRDTIERSHEVWTQAMGQGGTTAHLGQVYADERLRQVTEYVNSLRAAGQYRLFRRQSIEYRAVVWDAPDGGRVETLEEWAEALHDASGRQLQSRVVRERDVYSLRRTSSGWRITSDEVQLLDAPAVWHTVIIDSLPVAEGRTRQDAERVAAQVRTRGHDAGVLLSTDYPNSLRPGYWVAYSGRFATQAEALAHLGRVRAAGYPAAYLREIDH